MKALDHKTYRDIEWHLHNLPKLLRNIQECRSEILMGSVGTDYNTPKGHSKHADSTAQKGCMLADGDRKMQNYLGWVNAIQSTNSFFRNTQEASIITHFYFSSTAKIGEVAEMLKLNRNTVSRLRDNVVYRCAFYAAASGLIKMDGEENGR